MVSQTGIRACPQVLNYAVVFDDKNEWNQMITCLVFVKFLLFIPFLSIILTYNLWIPVILIYKKMFSNSYMHIGISIM